MTETITKGTTPTTIGYNFIDEGINFIKIESISDSGDFIIGKLAHISEDCHQDLQRSQLQDADILFSIAGALGRVSVVSKEILPANTNQALAIIRLKDKRMSKYVSFFLSSDYVLGKIHTLKVGVAQNNISLKQIGELEIPIVSDEVREQLVSEIEDQRKVIESNKKLIVIMENKISDTLSSI